MEQTAAQGRSLSSLLGELVRETRALVQNEATLVRAEVGEKIADAKAGAGSLVSAGIVLFAGLLILLQAAVIALALVVESWLAALIVGGVVTLIGLIMLATGRRKLGSATSAPRATVHSLQRDRELAKEHIS